MHRSAVSRLRSDASAALVTALGGASLVALTTLLPGCGSGARQVTLAAAPPSPSPRPSVSPSPTPSGSPTPTPSVSPTPTPSPSPSTSPTPTPTPSPTPTPTPSPSPSPAPYTITDLSALSGINSLEPTAINAGGQVVGSFKQADGSTHAFLYSGGTMTDLGPQVNPGGGSFAYSINAGGQVAGFTDAQHAYVYVSGQVTDLHSLVPSGVTGEFAYSINTAGQVTGTLDYYGGSSRAYLYSGGQISLVPLPAGGANSTGIAISDSGQIVGSYRDSGGLQKAYLYSGGQATDLGVLTGGNTSYATAINSAGQIVGDSATGRAGGPLHAFLYQNGQMTDLGTFSGGLQSHALGINTRGDIVGTADTSGQDAAFVYTAAGGMVDLNTLIPASAGLHLDLAYAINDSGQIIARGVVSGSAQTHAVLLTLTGKAARIAAVSRVQIHTHGSR